MCPASSTRMMIGDCKYARQELELWEDCGGIGSRMEEAPLVSIVTPSLNQGCFIEETILSVKNQTYSNIEHIVVDGGSTDETLDILRQYSDSIVWLSEPDEGQSDAINKGWRMSKGEILAYLNSDDIYKPWAVEMAVKYFAGHKDVDMVYGECDIIDEEGEVTGQLPSTEFNLVELLCCRVGLPQPAMFFRRSVLEEVGYLDTNIHYAMDYDLFVRVGLKSKIKKIPQLLADFRFCTGTKSSEVRYIFGNDHIEILNKLYSTPELPPEVRAAERQAYSCTHALIGLEHYSTGQTKQARSHLMRSVALYPKQLKSPLIVGAFTTSFLGSKVAKTLVKWKSMLQGKRRPS